MRVEHVPRIRNTTVLYACLFLIVVSIYFILSSRYGGQSNRGGRIVASVREGSAEERGGCNEITSSSVIAMDETGRVRNACRCHWPTLFGQKNLFSDCDVQHACDAGAGILVHKITGRPLTEADAHTAIDVHDYRCSACDRCNEPGPDPHTGLPSCLPRPFNDRERDMCVYRGASDSDVYYDDDDDDGDATTTDGDFRTTKTMLSVASRFVDKRFLSAFTDRVRNTAWVPNPCSFDTLTGVRLKDECELRMTRKSNVAYCAPLRDRAMTAVKDDTYLTNNGGRFPNACFRLTSNDEHVNGYVIEYFLRERKGVEIPAPVVSARIAARYVLGSVLRRLGLTRESPTKMLLFTQPEPPPDVGEFPHPFNARRMADFVKEENYWLDSLPAKCTTFWGVMVVYNCSTPVQPLSVPECSRVGEFDRHPILEDQNPRDSGWFGDQSVEYARTTVACLRPDYDVRFPIVPNYSVKSGSTNADPTSAILFFDKTNNTVYPHWKDVGDNVSGELDAIKRYLRQELRSLPNDSLE